jgi:hypothetical protein
VGWLHTAQAGSARGRWASAEDGVRRSGAFAYRASDGWVVRDDAGARVDGGPSDLWSGNRFERGDDFHRPLGPVVQVEHAGRRCWQVRIEPPARKRGVLTLVVDDETGLCLRVANDHYATAIEITDLELDVDVPDETFAELRAEHAERARERALLGLTWATPPPTPRWFPWRSAWVQQQDCLAVDDGRGVSTVGRAPLGTTAPADEFVPAERVVRLDARGWSWAVASEPPMDQATARKVVEQVVEDPSP